MSDPATGRGRSGVARFGLWGLLRGVPAALPRGVPAALPRGVPAVVVLAALVTGLLTGCGADADGLIATETGSTSATATSVAVGPTSGAPTTGAPTSRTSGPAPSRTGPPTTPGDAGLNGATAAPSWLGTRVLKRGPDGFGEVTTTPKELRNRRIITVDLLRPPSDGRFHSSIAAVTAGVAARSTWRTGCPVTLRQLRYVTVGFRGFDGRAHTGELLVNRAVARDVVRVFRRLFTAGWPIEEMRITRKVELSAPPTGDGNNTSAFVCRATRGATSWSQHAYGLAIDVNPFLNPYVSGRTLLPELAGAYTDRARRLPGMNTPGSAPDVAFRSIGWGWGGSYSSKKDWMHFSSTGR